LRKTTRCLGGLMAAACVAAVAEKRGSLSRSGAVAAALVGTLALASGWSATRGLLTFFIGSNLLSHLSRNGGRTAPDRSATQVLANGGVASAAWAANLLRNHSYGHLGGLAIGSLAAAAADTWATEIGQRWGGSPRLITSGRLVEVGESGGVTVLGTAAAFLGALSVALAAARPHAVAAITSSGFLGALVDSVLGATVQARYVCRVCDAVGERSAHCQASARLINGHAWMTNDTVNALATLVGGVVCAGLSQGSRRAELRARAS
jgi:uncharacterized protein (TIGR00297 family)